MVVPHPASWGTGKWALWALALALAVAIARSYSYAAFFRPFFLRLLALAADSLVVPSPAVASRWWENPPVGAPWRTSCIINLHHTQREDKGMRGHGFSGAAAAGEGGHATVIRPCPRPKHATHFWRMYMRPSDGTHIICHAQVEKIQPKAPNEQLVNMHLHAPTHNPHDVCPLT